MEKLILLKFAEQKGKDLDDIDHGAMAHRLKQDVVSTIVHLLFHVKLVNVLIFGTLYPQKVVSNVFCTQVVITCG